LRNQEANWLRERDAAREAATRAMEALASVRERLQGVRDQERETLAQKQRGVEALNDATLRESQNRMHLDAVAEKAGEELGVADMAALAAELAALEQPLSPRVEPGLAEGGDAAPVVDPLAAARRAAYAEFLPLADDELAGRVRDDAAKLARIGPVSADAIHELAELEARREFLRAQHDDVKEASDDMQKALARLNELSETRFAETFAAVRTNFQDLFARFFGGGTADLELIPPEPGPDGEAADPLDAGIEIRVSPPGKKPMALSLLSGGERSLCMMALLLALFRLKPSPYCILDEVDGPLSEPNIDVFMKHIREFSDATRFVIISHSLRTMSKVDWMWGVTHDEPGVSCVRSLRFKDFEKEEREQASERKRERQPATVS